MILFVGERSKNRTYIVLQYDANKKLQKMFDDIKRMSCGENLSYTLHLSFILENIWVDYKGNREALQPTMVYNDIDIFFY